MPTYDYRCEACGHEMEAFQSITANPLRKCPSCGKMKLRRLLGTGGGIIFKGSGFYQTDYRSDGYKAAAKADKEPSSKSGSNGDGKSSDSKKSSSSNSGSSSTTTDKSSGSGKTAAS